MNRYMYLQSWKRIITCALHTIGPNIVSCTMETGHNESFTTLLSVVCIYYMAEYVIIIVPPIGQIPWENPLGNERWNGCS